MTDKCTRLDTMTFCEKRHNWFADEALKARSSESLCPNGAMSSAIYRTWEFTLISFFVEVNQVETVFPNGTKSRVRNLEFTL